MQPTAIPTDAIPEPDTTAELDHGNQDALGPSTQAPFLKGDAKLPMNGRKSAHHEKKLSFTTSKQDRDSENALKTNIGKVGSDLARKDEQMIEEVIIESEVHVRRFVTDKTGRTRFAEERDEYLEEIEEVSPGKKTTNLKNLYIPAVSLCNKDAQ